MPDHYFTASPASAEERRTVRVHLAGQDVSVQVAAGVFSPDGLDKGTRVLLEEVPEPPASGTFLDLGCGWGPLALTLAMKSGDATVWAVDVNERARGLLTATRGDLGLPTIRVVSPEDVPQDVTFDLIWSNPPIRVGKQALHELLARWLPRLTPQGEAFLVVGKNLGSDSLQTWINATLDGLTCTRHASARGFRVLRVSRS